MQTFGGDPGELDGEASGKQYWQGRLHLLHHVNNLITRRTTYNEDDNDKDGDDKDDDNEDDDNEDDDDKDVKVKIDQSSATCSIASTFQSLMRTRVLP